MAVGDKGQFYMMEKITQRIAAYWNAEAKTNDKNHFYFWFHRIVAELYNEDLAVKQIIGNQEDAAGPHCFKLNPMNQKMLKHCWRNHKNKEKLLSFLDTLSTSMQPIS